MCKMTKLEFIVADQYGIQNSKNDFCQGADLSFYGFTETYSQLAPGGYRICFSPAKELTFHGTTDILRLQTYVSALQCEIWLDFNGQRAFMSNQSQDSAIEICQKRLEVSSEISFDALSYSSRHQPCADTSKTECLLKCREDFFVKFCGCYPISKLSAGVKPADSPHCAQMSNFNITSNEQELYQRREIICKPDNSYLQHCNKECLNTCAYRKFRFDRQIKSFDSQTDLKLSFGSFVYPHFEESLLMSWNDLLMALGGSIGFW